MLQHLVYEQELGQQIYQDSPAPACLVPGIKNSVKENRKCENIIHDAMVVHVDDSNELLLAHQEKHTLAGNKNEIGPFDGESANVINHSYQTWSVADNNTHEPDLVKLLTGNCDLNSMV